MRVKILKAVTIIAAIVLLFSAMALDMEKNSCALLLFFLSEAWLLLIAIANGKSIQSRKRHKKGSASACDTDRAV